MVAYSVSNHLSIPETPYCTTQRDKDNKIPKAFDLILITYLSLNVLCREERNTKQDKFIISQDQSAAMSFPRMLFLSNTDAP